WDATTSDLLHEERYLYGAIAKCSFLDGAHRLLTPSRAGVVQVLSLPGRTEKSSRVELTSDLSTLISTVEILESGPRVLIATSEGAVAIIDLGRKIQQTAVGQLPMDWDDGRNGSSRGTAVLLQGEARKDTTAAVQVATMPDVMTSNDQFVF